MSTNSNNSQAQLVEIAKAVGAIVGVPLALFVLANNIVEQPIIGLVVALIAAVLASVWVVHSGWTGITEVVIAWMALALMVLAGFVIWPKTMTVEGTIRDTTGNSVNNEVVVLFDRSGRRYETETNAEGYYQFTDVPTGDYRVRVRSNEVEGGTKGILVRVVQQNIAVSEVLSAAASPTLTPTESPAPTPTQPPLPTDTPTPTPAETLFPTPTSTETPSPSPTSSPAPTPSGAIGESRVYCTDQGSGGTEIIAVEPPHTVSAIRIDMMEKATTYGDSLREVEAYSPNAGDTNLITDGRAYASSAQNDVNCEECFAGKAIDGDMDTRWSSKWEDPQWLDIVLPIPQVVNRVVLKWEQAYARRYCVTVMPPTVHDIEQGDTVAQSLSLLGAYPPEVADDIWVLVGPPGENVWPQSPNACEGESTAKINGLWEVRIGMGGSGDVGRLFEIIVTTANDEASGFLAETIQRWCQQGHYPGLSRSELPTIGLRFWQSIVVRRGSDDAELSPDISNVELPGQVILDGANDGDIVPQSPTVSGTYSNDVTDHIWVLAYPPDGRYYPQSTDACAGISTIQSGGLWEARINLGGEGDAGKPFDIIVVLVNEEAHAIFEARQEEGCQTGHFPGLLFIELPQGIDEKDSVRVIRQ
jgi:hypothetical protein